MMVAFTRTPNGLAASHEFFEEPIVFLEGETDLPFFKMATQGVPCVFKYMGGVDNANKIIKKMREENIPCVIVVDGDYRILVRKRAPHRRVVMLGRYAMENYLFEKTALKNLCALGAQSEAEEDVLGTKFEDVVREVEEKLKTLVVLDVAARMNGGASSAIPNNCERLLRNQAGICFCEETISRIERECAEGLTAEAVAHAKELLEKFLKKHRLVDIVRGHFVFGLLKHMYFDAVKKKKKKLNVDNNHLLILLVKCVWDEPPAAHRAVRRKLRRAIREAEKLRVP